MTKFFLIGFAKTLDMYNYIDTSTSSAEERKQISFGMISSFILITIPSVLSINLVYYGVKELYIIPLPIISLLTILTIIYIKKYKL